MENQYIEKLQDIIDEYHIQLVSYHSDSPIRFYTLQNNRITYSTGKPVGAKLMIWIPENTLQSPLEQAWDVAHELGHAMLGHHYTENNDVLKKERDAWNKAECILLANNIPLHAPDGEWTFSDSFFVEKQWALSTYEKQENALLAATMSSVNVKLISYGKYVWIKIKQLLCFLCKSVVSGFAVIGLLFITNAPQMYQLTRDPDSIRSLISSAVIVYPSIYVSLYIMKCMLMKSEEEWISGGDK